MPCFHCFGNELGQIHRSDQLIDDRLNPITVRVDDKRSVVVFAILRVQFRGPVILAAVPECGCVKAIHGLARWRGKSNVEAVAGNRRIMGFAVL